MAEALGAVLTLRGYTPCFYRPKPIPICGVPRRPRRPGSRLSGAQLASSPGVSVDAFTFRYNWAGSRELARADVFIFALPSFAAEQIGAELAAFLSGKIVVNVSDRFLGTYALAVSATSNYPEIPPLRLGIAFNSPPLLAYQPLRDQETRIYYEKPFVMMACFPRDKMAEAQLVVGDLFGIPPINIRSVPSMLDLAFENINSILHAVQDLANLKNGAYRHGGSLYAPAVYTDAMVRRISCTVAERDLVAQRFVETRFRSLVQFDGTTFYDAVAASVAPAGTAAYRHAHPLLTTIPRPTAFTAHGYEDIGWSMVPLESFAAELGIKTPVLSALIAEWNLFMSADYRSVGRTTKSLRLSCAETARSDPKCWPWRFDAY